MEEATIMCRIVTRSKFPLIARHLNLIHFIRLQWDVRCHSSGSRFLTILYVRLGKFPMSIKFATILSFR